MTAGLGGPPVQAREKITIPFTCVVAQGRVHVEPAADQAYPIVGAREMQPFTYCPVGDGARCRDWKLQRFVVQCDGGRALWAEIVAAAGRLEGRTALENGQLLIRLGPRRRGGGEADCYERSRGPGRQASPWSQCQLAGYNPPRNAVRTHVLALPRGFAPLDLIGARVVAEADAPPPPSRPLPALRGPEAEPGLASGSLAVAAVPKQIARAVYSETLDPPPGPAAADLTAISLPVPEPPTVAEPPVVPAGWTPWVEMAVAGQRRIEVEPTPALPVGVRYNATMRLAIWLLMAVAVLGTTALLWSRRPRAFGWHPLASSRGGDTMNKPRAVALRSKAEDHIALISQALDRLVTVAPLRSALVRDLQASERRLAAAVAGISSKAVARDGWLRARRRLERITQDLDRLQQIAECAVASLSGHSAHSELPRSKEEAYAVLGVTAGVSDAVLKKLVEALRMSWHPDLAHSDEEREMRNIRITEINVAWDLITGKRAGG